MKDYLFLAAFVAAAFSAVVIPLYLTETARWAENEKNDPHANNPHHIEPPAWLPDTLCNGRPSVVRWTQTDQYRLKTGDMIFEWVYDEHGDSCLWAIVVRLPEGTIENLQPRK